MNRIMLHGTVLTCLSLTGVGGCVATHSSGSEKLTQDNVNKITKGVTTRAQVEDMLGKPDSVAMMPNGGRRLMYMSIQSKSNYGGMMSQALIPGAAFFPASDTSTMQRKTLQISLNSNDVVEDYEFDDNTTERKTTQSAFGAHTEETTPKPSETSGK